MSRFIDEFKTIPEFLVRTARIWPDRPAYRWYDNRTNTWVTLSWREFSERVRRWRKAFVKMGLKHGDRVCTIGGIYGTITGIKDETIELSVSNANTKLIVARWAIRNVEEVTIENDSDLLN